MGLDGQVNNHFGAMLDPTYLLTEKASHRAFRLMRGNPQAQNDVDFRLELSFVGAPVGVPRAPPM
jgi:hypothetical protein